MKQKEYTAKQLLEIIKVKGIVKAMTTKKFKDIPKGTILYFGKTSSVDLICSYDCECSQMNTTFKYKFNYQYDISWHEKYKGKFILLDTQDNNHSNDTQTETCSADEASFSKRGDGEERPAFKIIESIPTKLEYKGRIYILEQ